MPRLLFVSETFPPDASVGAKRTRRIAAYLADHGWDVDVLTVTTSGYERLDLSLLDRAPRYRVLRTFAVTPMLWGRRLRDRLRGGAGASAGSANGGPSSPVPGGMALGKRFRALLTTPDEYLGWIPSAVLGGLTRIARPDLVLASGPPFTSHLVAALIARMRRVPLVLDYRDPWTSIPHRAESMPPLSRLERRSESWVLQRTAGLVATTQGICNSLDALRRLPARVIPNAYDFDLVRDIEPESYSKFTLVYMGSFYPGRDPGVILRALAFLEERGLWPGGGLELRVIGSTPGDVHRALAVTGLHDHVVVEGLLPYREALKRIAGADVLVLVVGRKHADMIPGKLFDYLATGRFILGIGPVRCEAGDLLRTTGAGVMLDSDDVEGIAAALAGRFREPRRPLVTPDPEGPYEAGRTMRDLDRFLRDILAGRAPA
jgi:glycosyltransferase involved in cell wall biosynthesis